MKQVQFYYIACSRTLANFTNTTCNNILRILYKASFTTQLVSYKRDYSNRAIMDFVNLYMIIIDPTSGLSILVPDDWATHQRKQTSLASKSKLHFSSYEAIVLRYQLTTGYAVTFFRTVKPAIRNKTKTTISMLELNIYYKV